jgi:hypothetical protein
MWGYPVKIGAPKFVDFGKNMEHSPDGKAYLVAHGADHETTTKNWRMWNGFERTRSAGCRSQDTARPPP